MQPVERFRSAIVDHQRLTSTLLECVDLFERIAQALLDCFRNGGKVLLLGNGGSAADAQHIAAELVGRFKHDRVPLPAIALTTDTSILTAVSNDLGAEVCFARQIEALAKPGDIVWAISVSGRSPNVLRALDAARSAGTKIIGFTGRRGSDWNDRCDLCFQVEHESSDRVQEMHELAYHLVCERVEREFVVQGQSAKQ